MRKGNRRKRWKSRKIREQHQFGHIPDTLAPAVIPQMAGFAIGEDAAVFEKAREKAKMLAQRVKTHLPGGSDERMPMEDDDLFAGFFGRFP